MYFYSNRAGGFGGYDLWVSQRGDAGWIEPVNLGAAVNSTYTEYGPALTPDGSTLYFASNRPQSGDLEAPDPEAWPATVREDLHRDPSPQRDRSPDPNQHAGFGLLLSHGRTGVCGSPQRLSRCAG